MPFIGMFWDHVLKAVKLGTQALYFFAIVGDMKMQFPLYLRLYRGKGGKGRRGRPNMKKTEMALEMLTDFVAAARICGVPLERVVFVADS